jgi:uncharacterized protein (UPF0332 family)
MTLDPLNRKELIGYRLTQAYDTIADVELLIEHERYRAATNRIYYGMFYALLALGLKYQFETSKHQQLIGWFNKQFIHEGKIDAKFGRMLNKAFNQRTKSDYDSFITFDRTALLQMLSEMNLFIREIDRFIGETGELSGK